MKKKTGIIIAVVVLSLALVGSSLYGIFEMEKRRTYVDEYSISKERYDISKIEIYNRADNIDMNIVFLPPNSTNILDAYLNCTVVESFLHVPLSISISQRKSGDTLKIFIRGIYHEDDYFSRTIDWTYNIWISSDYESYIFDSDTKDGDVYLDAKGDFEFDEFKVSITTGSFIGYLNKTSINSDVILNSDSGDMNIYMDRLNIRGNVFFGSESGNVQLDLWEVIFPQPAFVNLTSDGGYLVLLWAQHVKRNNSVQVFVDTNYSAKVKCWIRNEFVRQDLKLKTEGVLEFDSRTSGFYTEVGENQYRNTNYEDQTADYFSYDCSAKEKLEVYLVNCFKPARFHDRAGGFWSSLPLTRTIYGSSMLKKSDFSIDSIQFSHKAQNHFDIPSNLNVTFGRLPSSSDNIFEASWNLTHGISGNHGYGALTPIFNYTVEGSILYLDLLLDFDETLIYPVFTDGFLTLNIHPDINLTELK
ncbi:hypothetical protein [Candidatus Lokiarchaeum ossiferum]|uniref:hypothetical protein n=1 Tax=Candidatus Lokiarchaeum ossiferum TaxID=2951803 RepID=UPI00352CA472